ncbi:MAG: carboxylating nicotinate-nucleotide diphosphorylase [Gammaproteobacteria bacterium]|nr:carboxylating nicotinate-nucleotide diphosphorylase [Gammaproteobacteria bacterium]MCP5137258.1 carboxylating nicotinate-nucleotide diphosphorylase [Gammaproteobacteria bacterium]
MNDTLSTELRSAIEANVAAALAEDIGDGDRTAALIPEDRKSGATVIAREAGVIAGQPWFDAVFAALSERIVIEWAVEEGARIGAGDTLCVLCGPARAMLSGERAALNFLQTLSAVATRTRECVDLVAGTGATILDTRKTLPGLRRAEKYAVVQGGGQNHRMGLYDAILIKENHIAAAGSIAAAVESAHRWSPGLSVEVEVEDLVQLEQALAANADIVMLDNFDLVLLREAVAINAGRARLEASGGVRPETLRAIAETGVDFVSIGALTKDIRALDLSMRFDL